MFKNIKVKTKLYLVTGFILLGFLITVLISYNAANDLALQGKAMYEDAGLGMKGAGELGMEVQRSRFLVRQLADATLSAETQDSIAKAEQSIEHEAKIFKEYEATITSDEDRKNFEKANEMRLEYDEIVKNTIKLSREGNFEEANRYFNAKKERVLIYTHFVEKILQWNVDNAKKMKLEADRIAENSKIKILISFSLVFIIGLLSVFIIIRQIENALSQTQIGLSSFFAFLNKESDKLININLDSKDEFGLIAKEINDSIVKIEAGLIADANAISNSLEIGHKVKAGYIDVAITATPNNPQLLELRDAINEMLANLNSNIKTILDTLNLYATNDFRALINKGNQAGEVAALMDGVNNLGKEITQMLSSSLQNGIDLQSDASSLKQAVEALSTASNEQAASLEETAAAMEEMTSNVQNNASKSNDMAIMAKETDKAAKEGAALAQRTASAMTEIQTATNSINDAVAIIENIAFQTNILSLNAAVEAATAGDAGKGFAVVAQEVRNLANRSADAAKEIKAMAAQAAGKSNEGMNIATELTKGFEVIASKIEQTTMLVQDVSNASKEQMQGIGQINTAITQLDQMTQENAKVAAQADSIANTTIDKAEAMVEDASSKEFNGKSNIRATQTTQRTSRPTQVAKAVNAAKPVHVKNNQSQTKAIPNIKNDDDIWESF